MVETFRHRGDEHGVQGSCGFLGCVNPFEKSEGILRASGAHMQLFQWVYASTEPKIPFLVAGTPRPVFSGLLSRESLIHLLEAVAQIVQSPLDSVCIWGIVDEPMGLA